MARIGNESSVLFVIKNMRVGKLDEAKRFIRYIDLYPDLHHIKEVSQKISAAHRTIDEASGATRTETLQEAVQIIPGPLSFKTVCEALPRENSASLRVCLSRLAQEGKLLKVYYGVYWNGKGDPPTEEEIIRAKRGNTIMPLIRHLTAEQIMEKLSTKLPAAMFRKVVGVLNGEE